jgi:hypothetical protein
MEEIKTNMKENTFTYTARSTQDPQKMAMFTLHNGTVSVQLGDTLMEQAEEAYESFRGEDDGRLTAWIKPVATGSLQRLLLPIPLADFDADVQGESLQATAWIRAGGLRLAPVMMTWQEVDNPDGANAFVNELRERKEVTADSDRLPNPFDYWASWIVIGLAAIVLPIMFMRQLKERRSDQS